MVVDACVWIAAFMARESHHTQAANLLKWLGHSRNHVTLPTLTLAEVAGAIARRGDPVEAAPAVVRFLQAQAWIEQATIDATLGQASAAMAMRCRLRGADAVYVALASLRGLPLITLDAELLDRAKSVVDTFTPEQWLAAHG